MSEGIRVMATEARPKAAALVALLADTCAEISVAGSVRRKRPTVADVEIVARPRDPRTFLARLDRLVLERTIHQARDKHGKPRWGDKYRALAYDGLKFDVFVADPHNYGYILWLRTGPGDANQYVMQQLVRHNAPLRAKEGYWTLHDRRLSTPAETDVFALLGMPYIEPDERDVSAYMEYLHRAPRLGRAWTYIDAVEPEPPMQQARLW